MDTVHTWKTRYIIVTCLSITVSYFYTCDLSMPWSNVSGVIMCNVRKLSLFSYAHGVSLIFWLQNTEKPEIIIIGNGYSAPILSSRTLAMYLSVTICMDYFYLFCLVSQGRS